MAGGHYRFYLQRDGQTFPAEVLLCDSDSDAMVKAKDLLAMSTTFRLMEVWQGTRKVGTVEKGATCPSLSITLTKQTPVLASGGFDLQLRLRSVSGTKRTIRYITVPLSRLRTAKMTQAMNTPNNAALSFDDMHDATLVSIAVDWASGTLSCVFRVCRKGRNEAKLIASGLTLLHCPRSFPWGRSVSVNEMVLSDIGEGQVLKIEMQSGDVIEANIDRAELT